MEWLPPPKASKTDGCCKRFCFFMLHLIDMFVRKGLGRILLFFVYGLVIFVFIMALGVVLPYESLWMPAHIRFVLIIVAIYLIFNILWHYHMACSTPSGRPSKSTKSPRCQICDNHKDITTHHCRICGECVVNMDHHCIWINRCVGAGNHRYFLQFTGFLAIACLLYCTAGFSTFYYNYWHPNTDTVFCHQGLEASFFWVEKLCTQAGDNALGAAIFFAYLLCIIIFILVGGLFLWNVVLISSGTTYIDILKQQTRDWTWGEFFTPWRRADFRETWIDFLNLRNGRTFCRHILLPSSHRPVIPLYWGDEKEETKILNV